MTAPDTLPLRGRASMARATRYWEPRRLLFSLVVVATVMIRVWPLEALIAEAKMWPTIILRLSAMVLGANLLYSLVYPVELWAQARIPARWARVRSWLWLALTASAATYAGLNYDWTFNVLSSAVTG